jgi:outer membrane protein TolC
VRIQDARFEELLRTYQNTVLTAQQEVADSITGYVHSREESVYLADSVVAAKRGLEISMTQYRSGGADYVRVLIATQFLVNQQDAYVVSRVNAATNAISLNRALGGGWELRQGHEFVPAGTVQEMRQRTNWGDVTEPGYEHRADDVLFPRPNTDAPHPNSK